VNFILMHPHPIVVGMTECFPAAETAKPLDHAVFVFVMAGLFKAAARAIPAFHPLYSRAGDY
jgi:hypothetical protein